MKKILIYNSGGGLGDSIQLFTLILSLQNHFKSAEFFYLGAHQNHFEGKLKEYKIYIKTLDLNLKYFGFRWWHFLLAKNKYQGLIKEKMDLIIDLQSKIRNTLILRKIPHDQFYSSTYNYWFCTKKNKRYTEDHLENLSNFCETSIKTINFNFNHLEKKFLTEAKRLLPDKNYVGFSVTQGNQYRKKSWSIFKFTELANKIISKKKIPVFFIEKENINLIEKIKTQVPSAIFPELNSNLACPALVTALSSRLEMAVTVDNGIMHMMSLANISMIVLFGPTSPEKFAPKNKYIKIIDSKKLHNTKDINSIEVDEVLSLI
ncbi:lipopolysaccharide heptosyltransferase family protein [Candidatus Pelagibacter bacterium]|nr:lipopolysaccharide heptosyltransferase family protein [Candidatus Pelagibacter bacterium]